MTTTVQVGQLIDAQSNARAALTTPVRGWVEQQVRSFDGWYDKSAITALCASIVARVEPAQRASASLTSAFYARYLSTMGARRSSTVPAVNVTGLRAGVTHAGVYGRLADQYRYEVSAKVPPADALAHVVNRAAVLVDIDLALATRAQATAYMTANKIGHYRRVVRPELAAGGVCDLCVAASDAVHAVGEPMPMHPRCSCLPLPVVGGDDPGAQLNESDLTGANVAHLRTTPYTVHDHSELGPVLTARDAPWHPTR